MDETGAQEPAEAPSGRVKVRRAAARGRYGKTDVVGILDAGLIAHVGVLTPEGPLVLPMAYGHDGVHLFLHGAVANHLLGSGQGQEVCVTVTHLDGLVMARTPFHNSMNYRSVVVRGRARRIEEEDRKAYALKLVTDHVVANWDGGRPPSPSDLRKTLVVEVPLAESSAKIRNGDPIDEPEDIDGPWWAGVVPVTTRFESPRTSGDFTGDADPPSEIAALSGLTPEERLQSDSG
ncbi:MAG: pyridoxamine 5'-phosphate oxidase family protein [Acidimicrobiia bacterium]|nr:pyridoxamine 5'-phosphate oxidase family protein [Acidimicrobiia bacterium]